MHIEQRIPGAIGTWDASTPVLIQQLYANRGIGSQEAARLSLQRLILPQGLGGIEEAVRLLHTAIESDQAILISGDYDCDGATATTVAVRGLRMLGAKRVGYIIPDRFKHGYGLTTALIDTMDPLPDVIVTVDSGVSSLEGVAYARAKDITVIVTDHHLSPEVLPNANAIVNPNVKGDPFSSKALAGVGVIFYVLMALRAYRRSQKAWEASKEPNLSSLLDIVALGTVADLVPLDTNNRILVKAGLERIRHGYTHPGILALFQIAERDPSQAIASDFSFALAPRINAAGRLANMREGVECLLADTNEAALLHAQTLDAVNRERKSLQATMTEEADQMLASIDGGDARNALVVYHETWHPGVVGLVASKLKEAVHLPTFAFAPGDDGSIRGSGRSIPGFHLRDALTMVNTTHPGLIMQFGGHAMAAGLTIKEDQLEAFRQALDTVASSMLTPEMRTQAIASDGSLPKESLSLEGALAIEQAGPWGQAFPEPVFDDDFQCIAWRRIGASSLLLQVQRLPSKARYSAIAFNQFTEPGPPIRFHGAYRLTVHRFAGKASLQLELLCMNPSGIS